VVRRARLAAVPPCWLLLFAGCTGPSLAVPNHYVPTWELATAEPVATIMLGRARVSFDRPLPSQIVQPLSESFSLVLVRHERDWGLLARTLKLPRSESIDLSKGAIVGILANVGESATEHWPIHLRAVRMRGGDGWVEADFTPGIYYPLKTASYVELAYAPGLRDVRMVRIGQHTFRILPVTPVH
jgi:hypothetical protein